MSFFLAVFWRLKSEIVILFSRKQGVKILPFLRLRSICQTSHMSCFGHSGTPYWTWLHHEVLLFLPLDRQVVVASSCFCCRCSVDRTFLWNRFNVVFCDLLTDTVSKIHALTCFFAEVHVIINVWNSLRTGQKWTKVQVHVLKIERDWTSWGSLWVHSNKKQVHVSVLRQSQCKALTLNELI